MANYRRDILWQDRNTNHIQVWSLDGIRIVARREIVTENGQRAAVGLPWSIVGTGDFNGDGKTDILWQDRNTNHIQIWSLDGVRIVARREIVTENGQRAAVGLPWSIVGTGDFNGDGKTDILWQDRNTNHIQVWSLDGVRIVGRREIVTENGQRAAVGLPWSIVGTGDFNGDGKTDILWQDRNTNHIQVWSLDGVRIIGRREIVTENGQRAAVGLPWSIVGTGDFNGDGKTDILWQDRNTNHVLAWLLDGVRIVSRQNIIAEDGQRAAVGLPWSIVGTGFYSTLPARLQFRLRGFTEHDSTDTFLQGAGDETYLSAIGLDSAAVLQGPNHQADAKPTESGRMGPLASNSVRGPWKVNPYVLMDFDLRRPSSWPRSFTVTLLLVEEDNQSLAETFGKLRTEVGDELKRTAVNAASSAAGAAAGAAIGSVLPGIGTAVGAAVGAITGATYDAIIGEIEEGLANEAFTPLTLVLKIDSPERIKEHAQIGRPLILDVQQHGAHYAIAYDWNLS